MILATPISVCIQIIKYLNRAIKSMKSLLALFFYAYFNEIIYTIESFLYILIIYFSNNNI
ncbi:hypothetical protein BGU26_09745 [Clostridioides difficile]|nr:hypothetical protein BGU26_09745 [Clostridioides difficile]